VQQRAAELTAAAAYMDDPPAYYDFDKYIGLTGAEILHQILLEREVKQVRLFTSIRLLRIGGPVAERERDVGRSGVACNTTPFRPRHA
jgi:hypothetical protein